MKKDLIVGSVRQAMGSITLRVLVDISDTHVGFRYVMSSDGMPRTAESIVPEFLENHTLFYKPKKA